MIYSLAKLSRRNSTRGRTIFELKPNLRCFTLEQHRGRTLLSSWLHGWINRVIFLQSETVQTRLYLNFTIEQVSKVEFEIKFRKHHRVVDGHFLGKGRNTRPATCYSDNNLTAISYVIRNEVERQKERSGRSERRKPRRGDSRQAQLPLLIKFATRDRSIYGPCVFVNFSIIRSRSQKLRRQPVPSAKRKTPGMHPPFSFSPPDKTP